MLDFVSTREGVDIDVRRCAQLLAWTIADAIERACMPPTPTEKRAERSLDYDAAQSVWFLYSPRSVFELYATMIGSDATAIREGLLRRDNTGTRYTAQMQRAQIGRAS